MAPYYDEEKEYWENGHLVGLSRSGVAVSLEPGGQVETSIGILKKPSDLNTLYSKFRRELDPILTISTSAWSTMVTSQVQLCGCAGQPQGSLRSQMTDYLGRVGSVWPLHDALLRLHSGQH